MYNSKARKTTLKKAKPYKCEICGNEGFWNNKPLSLQVDHINGISNDNSLENLRFLCPNCHSQTSTFTGRNAKLKIWNRPSKEEFLSLLKSNTVNEISIIKAVSLRTVYGWFNYYVRDDKPSKPKARRFSCEEVSKIRDSQLTSEKESILHGVSSKTIRAIRRKQYYCDCN